VLFVTHDVDVAARCATHVALLHDGRVLAGGRDAVLTRDNLARVYGVGGNAGDPPSLLAASHRRFIGGHR
jgi:ABC-type cobalamin/Fe3+-siderophores transport system ATPase subunit